MASTNKRRMSYELAAASMHLTPVSSLGAFAVAVFIRILFLFPGSTDASSAPVSFASAILEFKPTPISRPVLFKALNVSSLLRFALMLVIALFTAIASSVVVSVAAVTPVSAVVAAVLLPVVSASAMLEVVSFEMRFSMLIYTAVAAIATSASFSAAFIFVSIILVMPTFVVFASAILVLIAALPSFPV